MSKLPVTAPTAPTIREGKEYIKISCPYCHKPHEHSTRGLSAGKGYRLAPGCGLRQSTATRLAGYWIILKP